MKHKNTMNVITKTKPWPVRSGKQHGYASWLLRVSPNDEVWLEANAAWDNVKGSRPLQKFREKSDKKPAGVSVKQLSCKDEVCHNLRLELEFPEQQSCAPVACVQATNAVYDSGQDGVLRQQEMPKIGNKRTESISSEARNGGESCDSKEKIAKREAFDYVLGSILGDGSIHKTKGQLVIDQSIRNYTIWKYLEAARLGLATPKTREELEIQYTKPTTRRRLNKQTQQTIQTFSYRGYTKALFKAWRPIFYTEKKIGDPTFDPTKTSHSSFRKKIPAEIGKWLTSPYSLAIFYMDDGSFVDNSALIRTGEIPKSEVQLLQQALAQNFGLETTIRNENTSSMAIYVCRDSWNTFKTLVEPTILQIPEMHYKLGYLPPMNGGLD
jgi:LAGLIDADG DNA endonuclease family